MGLENFRNIVPDIYFSKCLSPLVLDHTDLHTRFLLMGYDAIIWGGTPICHYLHGILAMKFNVTQGAGEMMTASMAALSSGPATFCSSTSYKESYPVAKYFGLRIFLLSMHFCTSENTHKKKSPPTTTTETAAYRVYQEKCY